MATVKPGRGPEHHGMEFDSSFISLHARFAVEMGGTLYGALPAPDAARPNGYQIYYGEHGVIVATQLSGLQETRKEGSFVSRVDVSAQFAGGQLNGVVVQFYRPHRGRPLQFYETACAADDSQGFMVAMSQLPRSQQRDINNGLQTLGIRMGLSEDDLAPSQTLQDDMAAKRARQMMAQLDERLREPELGAA